MEHLTKKELKTPDKIWLTSRSILDWVSGQWVLVAAAAGLIFVAIVGISLYVNYSKRAEGEAQEHFSKAKSLFEQAQIGSGTAKDEVKVELHKALDSLSQNHSGSKADRLANLMRARLSISEKKFDEGIAFLEKYKSALPAADKELALYPLGATYEEAGKFEKARATYGEIAKNEKSSFRAEALLGKARAERSLEKFSDARATYSLFLEKFPQSLEAPGIRGLMSQLPATTAKP